MIQAVKPSAAFGKFGFVLALTSFTHFAFAAEVANESATPLLFKITPSVYQSSDHNNARDINARINYGPHGAWVGVYRDDNGFQQSRTGYDYTNSLASWVKIVASAQSASGGFVGGSLNAQLGGDYYAIVGFGRTNLRNYYNLNFDPNDAITLGVGGSLNSHTDVSLYQIWDDRLGTQQRVTHAYMHYSGSDQQRFSLDAAYKHGMNSEDRLIYGYSFTATYAYHSYFVRFAHDEYANFSAAHQNRISLGLTF